MKSVRRDFTRPDHDTYCRFLKSLKVSLTLQVTHVPSPLHHGHLETETDAQERHTLLSSPLDRSDHALGTSLAETAGDDDTLGRADGPPGIMVPDGAASLRLGLEVGRVDPL